MTDAEQPRYPLVIVDTLADDVDVMIGRLTLLGAEGIEERDATTLTKGGPSGVTLVASFATFDEARAAAEDIGPSAHVDELVGDAWRDAWREHWQATRLGSRIVVVPTWIDFTPGPADLVMRLDPGRAFGTGQHASTALAAATVEKLATAGGADFVIDLGCGSGILSFVALMLGVGTMTAADVKKDNSKKGGKGPVEYKQKLGYAIGMDIGGNLKKQEIDPDLEWLFKGIEDALKGREPQLTEGE
ncbi:MAG: 50S ribosomal protein L11 methyltransferase, partial [Deltaproteobacteria bacterium]